MAKESFNEMIRIILWILGFILILIVIFSFTQSGEKASQESICRTSVIVREKATLDLGITNIKRLTPLTCKSIDVGTISGTREEIKYQISELAAQCWWMYIEGTVTNLFGAKSDQELCGICYHFRIENELDLGEPSKQNFLDENISYRNETTISLVELYEFMLTNTYDRKILYGGGTKQYIGDYYEFTKIRMDNSKEIKLKDIKTIPLSHLQDYTGILSQETQKTIQELGDILMEKNSLLFVVVADKIQRNDRRDARQLIESLNMNSLNSYDAVLITIDATNGHIRLHLGQELEEYINELEIKTILRTNFENVNNKETLDTAVQNLIKDLKSKVTTTNNLEKELNINKDSFYTYLTNDAQTNIMLEDIEIQRQYIIAISSTNSLMSWWEGMMAPYNYQTTSFSERFAQTIKSWVGRRTTGAGPTNSIIIAKASTINEICNIR